MPVLFGVVPFVATAIGWWVVYWSLFRDNLDQPPVHWQWRLMSPLYVVSLTPLVLLGTPARDTHKSLLAASAVVGVLFLYFVMTVLTVAEHREQHDQFTRGQFFFSLRNEVPIGRFAVTGLTKARSLFCLGLTVIGSYAVITLIANTP